MKMFLIFSHTLTDEQVEDAKKNLGITDFVSMPEDLQKLWSQVDPGVEFPQETADKIVNFLKENSKQGDYVLVQGEFSLTYYIVNWCFKNKRIPITATSKRETVETTSENGVVKKSLFRHVRFRMYREAT